MGVGRSGMFLRIHANNKYYTMEHRLKPVITFLG